MGDNLFSAHRTGRSGIARVEARLTDFVYPAHSHQHVCVGLVWDGALSSRYGLHQYTVQRGDVILVNPGEVHDGRPSGRCGRRYSMLEIDPRTYRQICLDATGRDWVEFQQPILRDSRVAGALSTWLKSLGGADACGERESSTMLLGLVFAHRDRPRSRRVTSELAAKVGVRMRESAAGADSIGDLAAELGASRYQLIRAFKQAFGLTPEDFRRQLRIERARSELAGSCSLAQIAAGAGFADQSHMTREFRRMMGLTPSAYRRALR